VFYGAVWRGAFAAEVAASLAPAIAEFPEVEYLVIGDRAVFEALPTDRKVFHDYVPFEEYLRLMGTCAISLSPIEGRRHQDTKSDAKFLDAASRGVLTIASPTIYADIIRHGETGLIAPRVEDWAPLLAQALRDEPARRAMARRAWDYVRAERMFAHQIPERRRWYRDLWDRREALTADLIRRVPGLAEALGGMSA
jgi:glycosyltransferase involved in cell wall biosynthesis